MRLSVVRRFFYVQRRRFSSRLANTLPVPAFDFGFSVQSYVVSLADEIAEVLLCAALDQFPEKQRKRLYV